MTRVNVELAGKLLGAFVAWADLTPEGVRSLYPEWDPSPDTYQDDLEQFVSKEARIAAARFHPEALEEIKAAMRWVLRDAPDFALEWYDAALCELDEPPEPLVKMFEWAWRAVFGSESWDVEGEEFEPVVDHNQTAFVTLAGWGNRPPPNPRPYRR